jgi:hypothetical protein
MPFSISTLRIKNVLRKLAVPPAIELTREFIRINLDPVTLLVIPEKSFLNKRATLTEEPTAAEYPSARSLFVYLLEALRLP